MTSYALRRGVEKALGMSFEETQMLNPHDLREMMEKRHGRPVRLAVPFYDSRTGKWTDDPKHFGDGEKAYRDSIRRLI